MHKLMEYICDELEEIEQKADKGKLTMQEVQYGDTLAHMKKNLLKADEMMDDEYSMARGRMGNVRRDAKGRYSSRYDRRPYDMSYDMSYDSEMKTMIDSIRNMMPDLPEEAKHDAQKFMKRLESM